MTNTELNNTLGLSIFFGPLSLVIACAFFLPFYGVDFPDSMSLLTVVAPVLGAYTVVVARHFTRHRHKSVTRGRLLSWPFVIIALTLPLVLYAGTLRERSTAPRADDRHLLTDLGWKPLP